MLLCTSGSCENYTLQMYLAIGECDGSLGPYDMYHEAMNAIFKEKKPCHRWAFQNRVHVQYLNSRIDRLRVLFKCWMFPGMHTWF